MGTILIVDDDKMVVDMERLMLQLQGYAVVAETDPVRALERFRSQPDFFDLVITDLEMPSMSGIDFSRKLKAVLPAIPIILLTGSCDARRKENALSMGIVVVGKPLERRALCQAIEEILRNRGATTAGETSG